MEIYKCVGCGRQFAFVEEELKEYFGNWTDGRVCCPYCGRWYRKEELKI